MPSKKGKKKRINAYNAAGAESTKSPLLDSFSPTAKNKDQTPIKRKVGRPPGASKLLLNNQRHSQQLQDNVNLHESKTHCPRSTSWPASVEKCVVPSDGPGGDIESPEHSTSLHDSSDHELNPQNSIYRPHSQHSVSEDDGILHSNSNALTSHPSDVFNQCEVGDSNCSPSKSKKLSKREVRAHLKQIRRTSRAVIDDSVMATIDKLADDLEHNWVIDPSSSALRRPIPIASVSLLTSNRGVGRRGRGRRGGVRGGSGKATSCLPRQTPMTASWSPLCLPARLLGATSDTSVPLLKSPVSRFHRLSPGYVRKFLVAADSILAWRQQQQLSDTRSTPSSIVNRPVGAFDQLSNFVHQHPSLMKSTAVSNSTVANGAYRNYFHGFKPTSELAEVLQDRVVTEPALSSIIITNGHTSSTPGATQYGRVGRPPKKPVGVRGRGRPRTRNLLPTSGSFQISDPLLSPKADTNLKVNDNISSDSTDVTAIPSRELVQRSVGLANRPGRPRGSRNTSRRELSGLVTWAAMMEAEKQPHLTPAGDQSHTGAPAALSLQIVGDHDNGPLGDEEGSGGSTTRRSRRSSSMGSGGAVTGFRATSSSSTNRQTGSRNASSGGGSDVPASGLTVGSDRIESPSVSLCAASPSIKTPPRELILSEDSDSALFVSSQERRKISPEIDLHLVSPRGRGRKRKHHQHSQQSPPITTSLQEKTLHQLMPTLRSPVADVPVEIDVEKTQILPKLISPVEAKRQRTTSTSSPRDIVAAFPEGTLVREEVEVNENEKAEHVKHSVRLVAATTSSSMGSLLPPRKRYKVGVEPEETTITLPTSTSSVIVEADAADSQTTQTSDEISMSLSRAPGIRGKRKGRGGRRSLHQHFESHEDVRSSSALASNATSFVSVTSSRPKREAAAIGYASLVASSLNSSPIQIDPMEPKSIFPTQTLPPPPFPICDSFRDSSFMPIASNTGPGKRSLPGGGVHSLSGNISVKTRGGTRGRPPKHPSITSLPSASSNFFARPPAPTNLASPSAVSTNPTADLFDAKPLSIKGGLGDSESSVNIDRDAAEDETATLSAQFSVAGQSLLTGEVTPQGLKKGVKRGRRLTTTSSSSPPNKRKTETPGPIQSPTEIVNVVAPHSSCSLPITSVPISNLLVDSDCDASELIYASRKLRLFLLRCHAKSSSSRRRDYQRTSCRPALSPGCTAALLSGTMEKLPSRDAIFPAARNRDLDRLSGSMKLVSSFFARVLEATNEEAVDSGGLGARLATPFFSLPDPIRQPEFYRYVCSSGVLLTLQAAIGGADVDFQSSTALLISRILTTVSPTRLSVSPDISGGKAEPAPFQPERDCPEYPPICLSSILPAVNEVVRKGQLGLEETFHRLDAILDVVLRIWESFAGRRSWLGRRIATIRNVYSKLRVEFVEGKSNAALPSLAAPLGSGKCFGAPGNGLLKKKEDFRIKFRGYIETHNKIARKVPLQIGMELCLETDRRSLDRGAEVIRCLCGFRVEAGHVMVQCDCCATWQHLPCLWWALSIELEPSLAAPSSSSSSALTNWLPIQSSNNVDATDDSWAVKRNARKARCRAALIASLAAGGLPVSQFVDIRSLPASFNSQDKPYFCPICLEIDGLTKDYPRTLAVALAENDVARVFPDPSATSFNYWSLASPDGRDQLLTDEFAIVHRNDFLAAADVSEISDSILPQHPIRVAKDFVVVRIYRLWKDATGKSWMEGGVFLRPYDLNNSACMSTSMDTKTSLSELRWHAREVVYDETSRVILPLSVWRGRCSVLNPSIYRQGRLMDLPALVLPCISLLPNDEYTRVQFHQSSHPLVFLCDRMIAMGNDGRLHFEEIAPAYLKVNMKAYAFLRHCESSSLRAAITRSYTAEEIRQVDAETPFGEVISVSLDGLYSQSKVRIEREKLKPSTPRPTQEVIFSRTKRKKVRDVLEKLVAAAKIPYIRQPPLACVRFTHSARKARHPNCTSISMVNVFVPDQLSQSQSQLSFTAPVASRTSTVAVSHTPVTSKRGKTASGGVCRVRGIVTTATLQQPTKTLTFSELQEQLAAAEGVKERTLKTLGGKQMKLKHTPLNQQPSSKEILAAATLHVVTSLPTVVSKPLSPQQFSPISPASSVSPSCMGVHTESVSHPVTDTQAPFPLILHEVLCEDFYVDVVETMLTDEVCIASLDQVNNNLCIVSDDMHCELEGCCIDVHVAQASSLRKSPHLLYAQDADGLIISEAYGNILETPLHASVCSEDISFNDLHFADSAYPPPVCCVLGLSRTKSEENTTLAHRIISNACLAQEEFQLLEVSNLPADESIPDQLMSCFTAPELQADALMVSGDAILRLPCEFFDASANVSRIESSPCVMVSSTVASVETSTVLRVPTHSPDSVVAELEHSKTVAVPTRCRRHSASPSSPLHRLEFVGEDVECDNTETSQSHRYRSRSLSGDCRHESTLKPQKGNEAPPTTADFSRGVASGHGGASSRRKGSSPKRIVFRPLLDRGAPRSSHTSIVSVANPTDSFDDVALDLSTNSSSDKTNVVGSATATTPTATDRLICSE